MTTLSAESVPDGGPSMSDLEQRWIALLHSILQMTYVNPARHVIITPYNGNYGLAGYVLAVEGSPVRGMLIVQIEFGISRMVAIGDVKVLTVRRGTSQHDRLLRLTHELLHARGYPLAEGASLEVAEPWPARED